MNAVPKIFVRRPLPDELDIYYHLRWLTLREPKGLTPGSEKDELDGTDEVWDLAAFVNQPSKDTDKVSQKASTAYHNLETFTTREGLILVGVGRLQMMGPMDKRQAEHNPAGSVAATDFGSERVARARLMGVHPSYRRKGVGRALIKGVMEAAREWACAKVTADARIEALDYYLACGFEVVSNEYYIKNIGPHYRVERTV